jgi:hypothetical protein
MTEEQQARQQRDIDAMPPDQAATLLRRLLKAGVSDANTLIALAIRAGRKIRYATFPAEYRTVFVPPELEAEIEAALRGES